MRFVIEWQTQQASKLFIYESVLDIPNVVPMHIDVIEAVDRQDAMAKFIANHGEACIIACKPEHEYMNLIYTTNDATRAIKECMAGEVVKGIKATNLRLCINLLTLACAAWAVSIVVASLPL